MTEKNAVCVQCGDNDETVPLMTFRYKGKDLNICMEHLPLLIHKRDQLADVLPTEDK